ncbi:oligopeptide ABC transporter substrate-binding protein, partial [Virgibacillus halodenitrificans]|nr:oligopeptide ABC transporter substrate-binding protein [Virgibacillus halodenitrificans]
MKKVRVGRLLFALMVVFLLVLAACNSSTSKEGEAEATKEKKTEEKGKEEKKEEKKDGLYSIDDFSNIKTREGEAIDGGSFTFGLVSDSAFEGTLNWNFYSGDPDAQILDWFD